MFLSEILTAPDHSLIQQSREASKCKTAINADGFGLAWYDQHPNPGLYRDVYPAWSDANLKSLAEQVVAATGSNSEIKLVPYDTVYPEGFEDMQRRLPDVSKLQAAIDFRPMRTLAEIISDVIDEKRSAAAEN